MKTKRRAIKVWVIFRFKERFELPDDSRFCRKGPLMFIREYVGSGQNDEAINYKRQITACKASPNRYTLLAVFGDLRDIAANYSRAFRGYILDEKFEPAGINKIAGWIGLSIKESGKILKELEQIGLIEKVPIPKFNLSVNNEGGEKKGKKQKSRAPTRKLEKVRAPLKNKKDKSGIGNGKRKGNKKIGNKPEKDNKSEKNNPKESDGEVGKHNQGKRTYPPRQSFQHRGRQPEQLGNILHRLYNSEAKDFAIAVYEAIGTSCAPDSREGRSELACWLQAWAEVQLLGLNPVYLTELWNKTIAYAGKLKAKRMRTGIRWTKSPEAVLRWMFKKYLANIKQQVKKAEIECAKAVV